MLHPRCSRPATTLSCRLESGSGSIARFGGITVPQPQDLPRSIRRILKKRYAPAISTAAPTRMSCKSINAVRPFASNRSGSSNSVHPPVHTSRFQLSLLIACVIRSAISTAASPSAALTAGGAPVRTLVRNASISLRSGSASSTCSGSTLTIEL